MNIPILSLTLKEYASLIKETLGKGARHAEKVYASWCRKGTIPHKDPLFRNAQLLLENILNSTDFTLPRIRTVIPAGDTRKILIELHDGLVVESVVIPMKFGWSLCVSSQVGCRMGCTFCQTGRMGLKRHLTAGEIVSQLYAARNLLGYPIRNVVFMGMGEPMDNLDAVLQAIEVMTDQSGFALGKRHITISTVGRIDGIRRLIDEADPAINLAVSINAPNDAIRKTIMPITRKYSMEALRQILLEYCAHPKRAVLVEYVLIGGVTDSLEAADELADYLRGLRVKVSLIPYNAQASDPYDPPADGVLDSFAERMRLHGYYTLVRRTRGIRSWLPVDNWETLVIPKRT